ncbi:MAG: ribosome biogenesis GTP-binding protein YihA/YsxC [Acidobacteriota bacterium]|nr:ribosome biogenesis GTP-binding protein YihA/YsxC [Acidobacteriota bacterium]
MKKKLNRGSLVAAVHRTEDFPAGGVPVVAVVGRSNVGKSSLLNRLIGSQAARTGKTPGKTRGIYFYEARDGHHFADLPGAGFARRSKEEREGWARLAEELFRSGRVTVTLRLIDSRVADSAADREIRDYLENVGVPSVAVATKWDRLGSAERVRARRAIEAEHGPLWPVSAKTGEGVDELRREIRRAIARGEERSHG